MPTLMSARTVAKLKRADAPYYVTDALIRGLQIRVAESGEKSWSVRYRIDKRMRRLTLGSASTLSLADAREMAKTALKQVAKGADPAADKQERRTANTVQDFAEIFIEEHAKKKQKRWKGVKSRLDNDVLPKWKHRLMKDITRADVRQLIDEIAKRPAPISANRVRALLSKFFNIAIQMDVVGSNPVIGTGRPGVERRRDRVLTADEVRRFWSACDRLPTEMGAAWKLRLITAQRAAEVHDVTWNELDLTAGWWTIPAERSKNGLAHRVWLSPPAVAILKILRAKADAKLKEMKNPKSSPHVLHGARDKKLQAAAAETFKVDDFRGHDPLPKRLAPPCSRRKPRSSS